MIVLELAGLWLVAGVLTLIAFSAVMSAGRR